MNGTGQTLPIKGRGFIKFFPLPEQDTVEKFKIEPVTINLEDLTPIYTRSSTNYRQRSSTNSRQRNGPYKEQTEEEEMMTTMMIWKMYRLWQWTLNKTKLLEEQKKQEERHLLQSSRQTRWVQVTKSQTAPDANGFKGSLSDKEKALTRAMTPLDDSFNRELHENFKELPTIQRSKKPADKTRHKEPYKNSKDEISELRKELAIMTVLFKGITEKMSADEETMDQGNS
ncbi:DgyrCDS14952 [Dimorphilus gyrociliatus]|uniref:DgyrCDS14952 n=1 Tax=Dimorphilus gyrociliatus TaxID=2664684 RepID=A0A7I8WFJ6_9ANNE|nr:DgyrCDS14952 [Dimorphilus gyrociliatus]